MQTTTFASLEMSRTRREKKEEEKNATHILRHEGLVNSFYDSACTGPQ